MLMAHKARVLHKDGKYVVIWTGYLLVEDSVRVGMPEAGIDR